jgi:hypothetical protein
MLRMVVLLLELLAKKRLLCLVLLPRTQLDSLLLAKKQLLCIVPLP